MIVMMSGFARLYLVPLGIVLTAASQPSDASHLEMVDGRKLILDTPAVSDSKTPNRYVGKVTELPGGQLLQISDATEITTQIDCTFALVLCVPTEFPNLQAAADVVKPGETVVAEPGSHQSFVVERGGSVTAPIRFLGRPGAVIDRYPESDHGIVVRSDFTRGIYADYIHLIGFTIIAPKGRCVYFTKAISTRPTSGHVISRIQCLDAADHGLYFSQVANSYIANNYIVNAGNESQEHGIYFANGGTGNVIVYDNIVAGSKINGIHCNGDMSIDFLPDGTRGGVSGTDGLVTGMIFDSNVVLASGLNGISLDGCQQILFVNNVIAENNRHGVRGYAIDAAAGPAELVFVNNTFVGNISAIKLSQSRLDPGFIIFNNLFVDHSEQVMQIDQHFREGFSLELGYAEFLEANALDDVHPSRRLAELLDLRLSGYDARHVLDRGVSEFAGKSAPAYDLRGEARTPVPDIGAFEYAK